MKTHIIFSALIAILLSGCDNKGLYTIFTDYRESYIDAYMEECGGFRIYRYHGFSVDEQKKIMVVPYHDKYTYNFDANDYSIDDGVVLMVEVSGLMGKTHYFLDNRGLHSQIAASIGDTSFHFKVKGASPHPPGTGITSIMQPVESLRIVSDRDFGGVPAGGSLNHVFDVYFNDALGTVGNKYKQVPGTYELRAIGGQKLRFATSFVKATADDPLYVDRQYIGNAIYLHLTTPPAEAGEYRFTVTIKFRNGVEKTVGTSVRLKNF